MVKYMNRRMSVLWSIITCVGLLFFVTNTIQAQGLGDLDQLFSANAADVETLTKAYLNPLATGFSTAINSGWVTKAKPTKKLGFSVQLRSGFTSIPSSAQAFDVNNLDLTGNYRIEGNTSYTINGDEKSGQQLFPIVDGVESPTPITMPKGNGCSVCRRATRTASVSNDCWTGDSDVTKVASSTSTRRVHPHFTNPGILIFFEFRKTPLYRDGRKSRGHVQLLTGPQTS